MNASKQIKFGIILQYLQMSLSIVISLIYTPAMLRILGKTEYGIYNLASSIISYLSLLSLGFSASYIRFYSKYKNGQNNDGVKNLNGLYLLVFCLLGAIALTVGLFLSSNVSIFFNESYSSADINLAGVLMIFLSVNLAISFPASVFTAYITSQEQFVFLKTVNIGKTVISPCLCIVALFFGYGSIGMVVITTVIALFVDLINALYCILRLKMRFSIGKFKNNLFLLKDIALFSVFIAINQIIDQINWQTDKIILGKMINSVSVSIYAIGATINTLYISFSTAISNVFTPRIHSIVSDNKRDSDEQLSKLFVKVGRLQFFVLMLVLLGFVFFGKYFISVWAGEGFEESYYIALLLMAPVTISLIQNLGIEIQRAKNKHQFRSIVYLLMAILNVFISLLFCKIWGTVGVAVGTTISLIVANGIIMNFYYKNALKIDIAMFWKNIILCFPSLIIPCAFGLAVVYFDLLQGLASFLILVIVFSFIYFLSVYLFGLNVTEKEIIKRIVNKIFIWRKNEKY